MSELKPCPFCGKLPEIELLAGFECVRHEDGDCPICPVIGWSLCVWNCRFDDTPPVWTRVQDGDVASAIHYPDCWDTACYPTLASALSEMYAWFECSNDDCERPTSPAAEKHTESEASE